jgi:hypothetical protein
VHFGRSRGNQDVKHLHGKMEWDVILLLKMATQFNASLQVAKFFLFHIIKVQFPYLDKQFCNMEGLPYLGGKSVVVPNIKPLDS